LPGKERLKDPFFLSGAMDGSFLGKARFLLLGFFFPRRTTPDPGRPDFPYETQGINFTFPPGFRR